MKTTLLGIKFDIIDLDANYEVIGNSDNYSFQYKLGKGVDLLDQENSEFDDLTWNTYSTSIDLYGNYGLFTVRVFAVSDIGIRSAFLEKTIEINPPEFNGTFSFSNIELIENGEVVDGVISKTPTILDNEFVSFSEYSNKQINIRWKLTPPMGHSREGEALGQELLADSFFEKFEIKIKNGVDEIIVSDDLLNDSSSFQQYLSSASVSASLSEYRSFNLELSEAIFNELNLDRDLSIEIKCFDSKGGTSVGSIYLKNPKPLILNFKNEKRGLNHFFSWKVEDKDFKSVKVKYLAIPGGVELISQTNLGENGEYFKKLAQAQSYENIKGKTYEQGEKVRFDGYIYESIVQHVTKENGIDTSPENTNYWSKISPVSAFIYRDLFIESNSLEITQLFGYNYFFSFQPVDGYGEADLYNLTEIGLSIESEGLPLRGFGSSIFIGGLKFYERKDDLVFNWDILDERGSRVDLNEYKSVVEQYDVPLVLGVSGSLFDVDTSRKIFNIHDGNSSSIEIKSPFGENEIGGIPTYEIYNKFEYTRDINNALYDVGGFPADAEPFDLTKIYTPDYSPYYVTLSNSVLLEIKSTNSLNVGEPNIRPAYPIWDSNVTYYSSSDPLLGDIVIFEKELYKVIKDFGPESDFVKGIFNENINYIQGDLVVAPKISCNIFNPSSEYFPGDVVFYQGKVYVCAKYQSRGNAIYPAIESDFWKERGINSLIDYGIFECLNDLNAPLSSGPSIDNLNWLFKNPVNSSEYLEKYIERYPLNVDEWSDKIAFAEGSYAVYNNDIFFAKQDSGPNFDVGAKKPDENSEYWSTGILDTTLGVTSDITTNNQPGDLVFCYGAVFECLANNPTGAPIPPLASVRNESISNYQDCQWRPFWEINDTYKSRIFGHVGIPESGKRDIGFEVGIVAVNGDIISSQKITGTNPPPQILRQGFDVNSTSKASRVRFNFNYKEGFAEKTTKVNLYRSSEPVFDITGSNKFAANSSSENPNFIKTVIGEGESADFGDNITELFDDPPLFVDEDGIEHPTGYYYKILPFDDFGSGVLYGVKDNMHDLEKMIVYPKSYHNPDPNAPIGPIPRSDQPSLSEGQTDDLIILHESIPGPVVNLTGSTAFENYFLNWDIPNSERNANNDLVKVIPNDIDHYEVWASEFDHLEVNFQALTQKQNASGYRRILGDLPSFGEVPEEMLDIGYDITNANPILEIDGNSMSLEAIHRGQTNEKRYFWIRAVDKGGNKSPFTGAAVLQNDQIQGLELILGQAKTTDIEHFEQNLTEAFPNTLALVPNDPFSDNTSSNGSIAWERHFVYYNGTGYVIGEGETDESFVYWSATGQAPIHNQSIVPLTSDQSGVLGLIGPGGGVLDNGINNPLRNIIYSGGYDTSNYHPAGEGTSVGVDEEKPSLLGDEHDFIIARNAGGIATPMWHSFANALIGTAHIQNAAITNAKIHNLTADKIRSAEIYGQDIQVGGDNVSGQIRSANFSGLGSTDANGDPAQGFAISGNGKFVFQTKRGKIYFEDDELTIEGNIKQKDGSDFTLLNISAQPNYFDYIETSTNEIVAEDDSEFSRISAFYKNSSVSAEEVRFKLVSSKGYEFFGYDDHVGGLYDISGFKYDPSLTESDPDFLTNGGFDDDIKRATAILDITGFDHMIRSVDSDIVGSVIIFASGVNVGIESATSIGILSDGAPGPTGRSPIYRGVWSEQKDYEGILHGTNGADDLRGDLVFLSGDYYIATNNSGPSTIGAKNPGLNEGLNFWKTFGAQFESVATKLLLAEDAVVTHSLIMGQEDSNNPGAGNGGIIKTVGKEYANGITGFFLANTGNIPNPQFDVGGENAYLRFEGLNQSISIAAGKTGYAIPQTTGLYLKADPTIQQLDIGGDDSFIRYDSDKNKIEIRGTFINNSVEDLGVGFSSVGAEDTLATFIGGGYNNKIGIFEGITNYYSLGSSIVGGGHNHITGRFSFIGGGFNNVVNDNFSAIVGGFENSMPLLNSGNEGANFIGAGVHNTISGGTTQSILNGYDNSVSDSNPYFMYDPDQSIFSEKFLGKGVGETVLTSGGYADNTRFPSDGSIDYWENGFFFSYQQDNKPESIGGLNDQGWMYSVDFGWFYVDKLIEDIYNFNQSDKFPNWIFISGDDSTSPQKAGLGWTFFQADHTYNDIPNTPANVTNGEGIAFYQPSRTLNPAGPTPGWVYLVQDNANQIFYSGAGSNINWQTLNN